MTDKYPIKRTLILITLISAFLEIPVGAQYFVSKKITFLIGVSILPSISMVSFNLLLHRQLKQFASSRPDYLGEGNEALKKSIFKAKMSMMITMTFVLSQLTGWISFYNLVSILLY